VTATEQSLPAGFQSMSRLCPAADELVQIYDGCLHLAGDGTADIPFGSAEQDPAID
jgi:hypothetical protein